MQSVAHRTDAYMWPSTSHDKWSASSGCFRVTVFASNNNSVSSGMKSILWPLPCNSPLLFLSMSASYSAPLISRTSCAAPGAGLQARVEPMWWGFKLAQACGIDPGEEAQTAALRELEEETSMRSVRVLTSLDRWLKYNFSPEVRRSGAPTAGDRSASCSMPGEVSAQKKNVSRVSKQVRSLCACLHAACIKEGMVDDQQASLSEQLLAEGKSYQTYCQLADQLVLVIVMQLVAEKELGQWPHRHCLAVTRTNQPDRGMGQARSGMNRLELGKERQPTKAPSEQKAGFVLETHSLILMCFAPCEDLWVLTLSSDLYF
eukprot:1152054-Pelagomonas_calceolata.AAC.3